MESESILTLLPGYDPWAQAGDEYYYDRDVADRYVKFFADCLQFWEGKSAGQPFVLQPWQESFARNLFGWFSRETGLRRYREALKYVARKNGKTPFAAGCILSCASNDLEPGGQFYTGAASRDQATRAYKHVRNMVLRNPDMRGCCKIYNSLHSIEMPLDQVYAVLSREGGTAHGGNTQFAHLDEIHAMRDGMLIEAITSSMGSREQPITLYTTTADFSRESECNRIHDYAGKVRDNIVHDPGFLPGIWELPREADWTDEDNWHLPNPNLGISVRREFLRREARKAQEQPALENTFRRLYMNQITEQDIRLIPMQQWNAGDGPLPDLRGRRGWFGLDLSTTTDLTALTAFFPDKERGVVYVRAWAWSPEETARERAARDRAPYLLWAAEGRLELTPGRTVDYRRVFRDLKEIREQYEMVDLAADGWNATQLLGELEEEGFPVVLYGQGFKSMNAPTKELIRLVAAGEIVHGGCPLLRWQASNLAAERDAAENLKPSKKRSTERIDNMVCLIMAIGRWMVNPDGDQGGSVYDHFAPIVANARD